MYYGHDLRLIVVESSAFDKKREKSLKSRCESEQLRIEDIRTNVQNSHSMSEDDEKADTTCLLASN